ncbi:MAG: radical SAM protein [Thermoflexales bacterium]|nr:radical SAM protein [Thermoflexales bacterium]
MTICNPETENTNLTETRPPALPEGVPLLTSFYLYLTSGCNLHCRHCWIAPRFVNGQPSPGEYLGLDLLRKAVEEAKPLGLNHAKLTGGEPTLHPQFIQVADYLTAEGISLTMETNGTLVDAALARHLKERTSLRHVSVSLDGPNPEVHDPFRGVAGCFEAAVRGIKHLVAAGYRPQVIMCPHRGNVQYVEDVVQLAVSLGAGSVKFNPVTRSGRGVAMHERDETLDYTKVMTLVRFVRGELQSHTPIRLSIDTPLALYTVDELVRKGNDGMCNVRHILGILGSGDMALCGIGQTIPELCFGKIRTTSVTDVWLNHPTLQQLRNDLDREYPGLCGQCIHARRCLTHCVAQNYQDTKQLVAPARLCAEAYEHGFFPVSRLRKQPDWRSPDPLGILAIHASAVSVGRQAMIFLGPSQSGKSTICRLLSTHCQPLADDKVYLIPRANGRWDVANADQRVFHGSLSVEQAMALEGIPLRAIFYLHKAAEPSVERLESVALGRYLTNALFELYWPQKYEFGTKRALFASASAVARIVPGYHLYFNRSLETWDIINKQTSLGKS